MKIYLLAILSILYPSSTVQELNVPYSKEALSKYLSYLDKSSGYFISTDNSQSEFMIGHVLDRESMGDVPVIKGKIIDCSEFNVNCKKIGPYIFVAPPTHYLKNNTVTIKGYGILFQKISREYTKVYIQCGKLNSGFCSSNFNNINSQISYNYIIKSDGSIISMNIKWMISSVFNYKMYALSGRFFKI